jgi:hypothetical protein
MNPKIMKETLSENSCEQFATAGLAKGQQLSRARILPAISKSEKALRPNGLR